MRSHTHRTGAVCSSARKKGSHTTWGASSWFSKKARERQNAEEHETAGETGRPAGSDPGGHCRRPHATAGRGNGASPKGSSTNTNPDPDLNNDPKSDPTYYPEGAHEPADGGTDQGVHTGDRLRAHRDQ